MENHSPAIDEDVLSCERHAVVLGFPSASGTSADRDVFPTDAERNRSETEQVRVINVRRVYHLDGHSVVDDHAKPFSGRIVEQWQIERQLGLRVLGNLRMV